MCTDSVIIYAEASEQNLSRPLDPSIPSGLEILVSYHASAEAPPLKVSHLTTSLLYATILCWVDQPNNAYTQPRESHYFPFLDIWHKVTPSLTSQTLLTPQKVGFAYIVVLQSVFRQAIWPGYIHAEIRRARTRPGGARGRLVGEMDVRKHSSENQRSAREDYDPLRTLYHEVSVPILGKNASDNQVSTIEPVSDRVWLELFASVIVWGLSNPSATRLPAQLIEGLHYFPSVLDPTQWLSLAIIQTAIDLRAPYKWIDLVKALMAIVINTARIDIWQTFDWKPVRCNREIIAWVQLGEKALQGVSRGDGNGGVETA